MHCKEPLYIIEQHPCIPTQHEPRAGASPMQSVLFRNRETDDYCSCNTREVTDVQTDTHIGMNHEYISTPPTTPKTDMSTEQDMNKPQWHVMRAYKSEKIAEERLSDTQYGLRHFIPKQKVLRTVNGRKVLCMVPIIHSLIFVYASHRQIVNFKHNFYYGLQFVTMKSSDENRYMTVPDDEMSNFIKFCEHSHKEVTLLTIEELSNYTNTLDIGKGKRVRVHGGPLDQVEGYFIKVAKKRGRQLVVIVPDLLVAYAEVEPDYIQFIDQ